jgi:CubicO group peptidase (beta-lactamase class C family)
VSRALALVVAASAACGTSTGSGRATAPPDLVGVWGIETSYDVGPSGRLVVTRTARGWSAAIAGSTAELAPDPSTGPGWWRNDVGTGEVRVHPAGEDPPTVEGFWLQPPGTTLGNAYAQPITLARTGPGAYATDVAPLPDELQLYVAIARDPAGGLTAFIREPGANAGARFGDLAVTRSGDAVVLRGADGKIVAHGAVTGGETPRLALDFDGTPIHLELTRRGRDDAPGFYPRASAASRYAYAPPRDLGDGWRVGTLAEAGMRDEPIRALVQAILDDVPTGWRSPAVHSLVVARRGVLVVDEYFAGTTPDTLHDSRSSGKSWASALAGTAVDRGELAADSRLLAVLGSAAPPFATPDARKSRITLAHLLSMSSGLDCDDGDDASPGNEDRMQNQRAERDWYRYMLALDMIREPGERGVYCSGAINLVGAMLAASGERWIPQRFVADLARPLDIRRFAMNLMPGEQGYLGGGVRLRPRDLAKLAQLYLDRGVWNGRRVVSEAWVDASVAAHASLNGPDDYGYGWWRITYDGVAGAKHPAFFASGNGGQLAIAIPSLQLVVAFTAGNYQNRATWKQFLEDWVPRYLLPAAGGVLL